MRIPAIVSLLPVEVEKPWGREIWFSGVEERGESSVDCDGERHPLSRILEKLGRDTPVTLLKRLEPTGGNLYIEVHQTKHEVYFIETAGDVLAGTNAPRKHLRGAASKARIDGDTDAIENLLTRIAVAPGDAIEIPPGVVHSLRRGVSVIEFQTPVYERKILTAYQAVATQSGWDIDAALRLMRGDLEALVTRRSSASFATLAVTPGFRLDRRTLEPGEQLNLAPFSILWRLYGAFETEAATDGAPHAYMTTRPTTIRAANECALIVAEET